jgi:hypothetical protein
VQLASLNTIASVNAHPLLSHRYDLNSTSYHSILSNDILHVTSFH